MSLLHWPLDLLTALLKHMPTALGVVLRRFFYPLRFMRQGKQLLIEENVTIQGFKNISLGNQVSLSEGSYLYAIEGSLSIGDNFNMNRNGHLDAGQGCIEIGNNCLFGPNVVLRAADHRFDDPDRPIREQGHRSGTIVIEDDVWLGSNVVVTKDVRIGRGSVIGAQSVVTRDIPPYSIAYGVPAQVVRSRKPGEEKTHG